MRSTGSNDRAVNGNGPASLTTWLMDGLTPGNIEHTLRHVATGWLAFTSAEAICVCWQLRTHEPVYVYSQNAEHFSFAEQPMPVDDEFATILTWATSITRASPESFQLQIEESSPVGFRVYASGVDDQTIPPELKPATHMLLERLETEAAIAERLLNSKLESMAEFAAGAGHEINNPVATILGRANLLLAEETDLDRRASLATIGAQALRVRDMIGDAMLFARPPKPQRQNLDIETVLPEIVSPYESRFRAKHVGFTCETIPSLTISADRTQFAVAISALLQNALEATSSGNSVTLVTRSERPAFVRFEIVDSGTGLSETDRLHLFDPFYSGRQAGRGLGFGLSKAWRIVTQHGGRIVVVDVETGGCRFLIDWPTIAE